MFSIVIPYYNKEKYIVRCIDSIINQVFKDFEILVVDDGSTDTGIHDVTKKYGSQIKIIRQQNLGVSAARNKGIQSASHDYIAFIDADDYWSIYYLEYVSKIIKQDKAVKIIGSHYTRNKDLLYNDGTGPLEFYLVKDYFRKQAIRNTLFTSSSTVISKCFFQENPGFNRDLKRGEDTDVWLRTVASGGNAYYINNTLVYYSDEDVNQVTKSAGEVQDTLVGRINDLYSPLIHKYENEDFGRFVSKYVYFNLFTYYFDECNREYAKKSLRNNGFYYFFLHLPYYLPFKIGKKILMNAKHRRILRLYFKFFLRNVYN